MKFLIFLMMRGVDMKKITITVDDATLANLEILRYYYHSNNSSLIRAAINEMELKIRGTGGHLEAVDKYIANHPEFL